jgi:hypothetical protein
VALAGVGAAMVVLSASEFDRETVSRNDFESLRLVNDVGWVAMGVGVLAFLVSYPLTPSLPEESDGRARAPSGTQLRLGLSPRGEVMLGGTF